MQTAKNAAATVKESASNVAASAKSGLDKTKATVQEKGERLTAHHPMEKEIATERKQEKIMEAEMHKQEARAQNAAAKGAVGGGGGGGGGMGTTATSGVHAQGHSTGLHTMSALPGHGTGETHGHVTEGVMGSHPVGTNTGTGGTVGGNPLVGGGGGGGGATNQGYGTGGGYS